jgi:tetratricopeptide (TPR) repeat protein
MEDQADYIEHTALYQIRDPQRLFQLLQDWQREHRLAAVQVRQEEGTVSGVILDSGGLVTAAGAANPYPKLGAYLLVVQDLLRLWSSLPEGLERTRRELQERAGPALSDARLLRGPAQFGDVYAEAVIFPSRVTEEEAQKLLREHVQRYFEETWIHRPLRSLDNVPPLDAAGHPTLRKRLLGVVQFLQECAIAGPPPYDFDRLRRKLGLLGPSATAAPGVAAAPMEIEVLSAAELAGLQPETLSDEQVEQAYRAAQKLDAPELASRFAQAMVSRPPPPDRPDRFPWYAYLVQTALAEGNTQSALQYVDEGEKADCEQNEGRRRNDYELRRGQVLAKSGDAEAAREVFERLIARVPNEVRFCGTAAESMLAVKRGATALQFAEQGLAKARQNNDRESEEYFLELVGAAKKQGGA